MDEVFRFVAIVFGMIGICIVLRFIHILKPDILPPVIREEMDKIYDDSNNS